MDVVPLRNNAVYRSCAQLCPRRGTRCVYCHITARVIPSSTGPKVVHARPLLQLVDLHRRHFLSLSLSNALAAPGLRKLDQAGTLARASCET